MNIQRLCSALAVSLLSALIPLSAEADCGYTPPVDAEAPVRIVSITPSDSGHCLITFNYALFLGIFSPQQYRAYAYDPLLCTAKADQIYTVDIYKICCCMMLDKGNGPCAKKRVSDFRLKINEDKIPR